MTSDPWGLFVAVAAAHALGVASPGPDWAVVLRQSLSHGRIQGMLTAAGISGGIIVHTAWSFFGLVQARAAVPALWPLMQYGGALVLLWLGYRSLTANAAPPRHQGVDGIDEKSVRSSFGIGLATNLFNPKAALFFLGLGAGVASTDAAPWLRLALSLWLVLATFVFFCVLSAIATHPAIRDRLTKHQLATNRIMGVMLIIMAIVLVSS